MEERTRFQNIVLVVLAAMVVIFGVLTGVVYGQKGVQFRETLLQVAESGNTIVYSGEVEYEDMEVTVTRSSDTLTEITFIVGDLVHDVCTVETGLPSIRTEHGKELEGIRITRNGEVVFEGGNDSGDEFGWYDQDGNWEPFIDIEVGTGRGYWVDNDISLGTIVYFARGPELTHRGSWGLYFLMVLLTGLLALDVLFPTALFYINHACDVRDPEPSDFYIAMQKVSWVIYPCFLLGGYIYVLTGIWR